MVPRTTLGGKPCLIPSFAPPPNVISSNVMAIVTKKIVKISKTTYRLMVFIGNGLTGSRKGVGSFLVRPDSSQPRNATELVAEFARIHMDTLSLPEFLRIQLHVHSCTRCHAALRRSTSSSAGNRSPTAGRMSRAASAPIKIGSNSTGWSTSTREVPGLPRLNRQHRANPLK